MAFGFNPSRFQVDLRETPTWAAYDRQWATNVTVQQQQLLLEQMPVIIGAVEYALQWAMTDPEANARFQHRHTYSQGVTGHYFVGRQYLEKDPEREHVFFLETECCLIRLDLQNLPEVYERFNIVLSLDTVKCTSQLMFAEEYEAKLGLPSFQLVRTLELHDVPGVEAIAPEIYQQLSVRWDEVRVCLQNAANEILENFTSSGQVDDHFMPCRLELTGEYYIHRSSYDNGTLGFMLHFLSQPRMLGDDHLEYLGYDVQIMIEIDQPVEFGLWGSSAI
jgi:hypothetical protein